MIVLISALILGLISTPEKASDRWLNVMVAGNATIAMDTSGIEVNSPSIYQVWFRWKFTAPQTQGKVRFRLALDHTTLRCDPIATKTLGYFMYDSQDNPVGSERFTIAEAASTEWRDPVPDTIGEIAYKRSCKYLSDRFPRLHSFQPT